MIKNILVCTDGSSHGEGATAYGIFLARHLEARIKGLHVLDSRTLEGPLMADISGWLGAQPYGAQLQGFRELQEEKGKAVLEAFSDRCEEEGLETETYLRMGHPATVILEEEGKTELVILGRRGMHANLIGDMMGSVTERVFRSLATPCLVTPETFRPITKILTAYDGSGHASQALREAVELARALNVELLIITVAEDGDRERAEELSIEGARLARSHDRQAVNLVEEGRPEDAITECMAEQECDLLVLGAHGHTRIREMLLGGTCTHLAMHIDHPVLIAR